MKGSLRLGTYAGVGVYLHWTFSLLIVWVFLAHLGAGATAAQALAGVVFVLILFVCIVLHEFGHALTARRYGIPTRDITLLPIGGIARLERMPEKPWQEFWVAVMGPVVNVAIAALLYGVLLLAGESGHVANVTWFSTNVIAQLMWVNLFIVGFNLLPAFPMDGGRILRALLSTRLSRGRATAIAAGIGKGLAILFGLAGFLVLHNPFLIFIAILVYIGAAGEHAQAREQTALADLSVRDAMLTEFRTLTVGDRLDQAVEKLLAGSQQDFPVVEDGRVVGVLRRNDLVRALTSGSRDTPVSDVMFRDCEPVSESAPLARTVTTMRTQECSTLPVVADGRLTGLLTLENVAELIAVNRALDDQETKPPVPVWRAEADLKS